MQSQDDEFRWKPEDPACSADLVRRALARNEAQLAAQGLVLASAQGDWDILMAQLKLNQLEADGKILRGEIPADSQFLIRQERAEHAKILWNPYALMKIKF